MKELIDKLRNANVGKDEKWIYTIVAYTLNNYKKDDFYTKIQNRIKSSVRSKNGSYRKYITQEKYELSLHKAKEKYKTDEKTRKMRKMQQKERYIAYNLYKNKQLSEKSTEMIDREIENEK